MIEIERTIISQYGPDAVTLRQLIASVNDYLDPRAAAEAFVTLVMDVATAQGAGLDVLGRIVGVNRVLKIASGKYLGFDEATVQSADPFGQSPFYGGAATTQNYALSDQSYRLLILAKAAANITDGSTASINAILRSLFPGRGNCHVADGLDMTMTYTFGFALTGPEQAIVENGGVLPKPAGVAVTYSIPTT